MVAEQKIVTSPEFGIRLQRMAGVALRTLLGVVLLVLVALNVVNAVARATGIVVIGVDEVLVFGMIWMVMLGMLLVTAERSHIALELLSTRAGPRMALVLSIVTHAVMVGGLRLRGVAILLFRAAGFGARPDQHGARHADADPAFGAGGGLRRHRDHCADAAGSATPVRSRRRRKRPRKRRPHDLDARRAAACRCSSSARRSLRCCLRARC